MAASTQRSSADIRPSARSGASSASRSSYVGLRRRVQALQLGGFALFGVSLAKPFLYDLAFLSSVARAFSFLAVGGVLLLAGFFYQRLSVDSTA